MIDKAHIPDDVSIFYKREVVPSLSKTFIIIWNKGMRVLEGDGADGFKISFPGDVQILSAVVTRRTNPANKFAISIINRNELLCNFEYLNQLGDGVTIETLHTGTNVLPTISGAFKDMPKGIKSNKPQNAFLSNVIELVKFSLAMFFIFPALIIPFWIGAHIYNFLVALVTHSIAMAAGLISGGVSFWFLVKLGENLFKRKPYASSLKVEGIDI